MSEEWVPNTSAEQLVRHWLRWDLSAAEIERRLADEGGNALYRLATIEDRRAADRLLLQRKRYDAAIGRLVRQGKSPTEENAAALLRITPRQVYRLRHGE